MVEIIEWPCDLLRLTYQRLFLQNITRNAGRSLSGQEQIIDAGAQHWQLSLSTTIEWKEDRIKGFEALISEMGGRRNIAAICLSDAYEYGEDIAPQQVRHSDGTWFSDDTGYGDSSGMQPLILTQEAEGGTNQLWTDIGDPRRPGLRVGDLFSVDGFLYRVLRRDDAGWVKFAPPARRAMPAGTRLETSPVVGYFRFASDDQGARGRDLLSYGEAVTLDFVEAFDRP